jgi:multiple sugar transport system ATP-binding protein
MPSMADITLDHVGKVFGAGSHAIANLDLRIADGERLVLVGPSGSGKSTVLRIIAGLVSPTSGRIFIDGQDVTDVPPERRDLAMVFQSYALYPHKTVRENLAFGLRVRGTAREEIERRVQTTAQMLGIDRLLDRMPARLSGGEQQRVAVGRAIVRQPRAFLFDEPLSNLDPQLRGETRVELVGLHERLAATMLYVTHDQEEAMTLGQRIAVLRAGVIEQLGTPLEVYERPSNLFVARFIGSPPMNVLEGAAIDGDRLRFETTDQTISVAPGPAEAGHHGDSGWRPGRPETVRAVGIRPHDVSLVDVDRADLHGTITLLEPLGHAQVAHVAVSSAVRIVVVVPPDTRLLSAAPVGLALKRERLHFFDRDGRRV